MVAFYKHDIPSWMDGTESLSDEAYRAYHVIVQLIYLNEGPIMLNEHGIAGRCRQSLRTFRKALAELESSGKISNRNGRLNNSRAEEELEKIDGNRINAAKGGKNRARSQNPPRKSLENHDAGQAPLQHDPSLKDKTRLYETREDETLGSEAPLKLAPSPPKRVRKPNPSPLPASPDPSGSADGKVVELKPKPKGSRLPPDWKPSVDDWEAARRCGLSEVEAGREVPKFRDYWLAQPGQKGVKADWPATWRNWVRRTAERLGRTPETEPSLFAGGRVEKRSETEIWTDRLAQYARTAFWPDEWGPQPGERGCRVPRQLVADERDVKFE